MEMTDYTARYGINPPYQVAAWAEAVAHSGGAGAPDTLDVSTLLARTRLAMRKYPTEAESIALGAFVVMVDVSFDPNQAESLRATFMSILDGIEESWKCAA